ncbi:hypothetical protein [Sorangium sp. So ce394]|uniref:hypothetical protein n=1 Tax=Sorangium sp. So ce394 TaxID=3133310 RepID=UPI003F5C59F1
MMRVHQGQVDILAEADFEDRVAGTIREHVPSDGLLGRHAREVAEHCIAIARDYGFEFENDIVTFVLHMVTISPEYHRQADIFRVLTNPSIPTPEKHNVLLHPQFEHAWEQAATMTDGMQYWDRHIGTRGARAPLEKGL